MGRLDYLLSVFLEGGHILCGCGVKRGRSAILATRVADISVGMDIFVPVVSGWLIKYLDSVYADSFLE